MHPFHVRKRNCKYVELPHKDIFVMRYLWIFVHGPPSFSVSRLIEILFSLANVLQLLAKEVTMVSKRDISANALARLQRMQDLHSQYFDLTIRVVERDALKNFTITSNSNPYCSENRAASPDICMGFHQRMIDACGEKPNVTTCPFGCLLGVAPLGRSLETGSYSTATHYLVVTKPVKQAEEEEEVTDIDALLGGPTSVSDAERDEFRRTIKVIASSFDLVLALMHEEKPLGSVTLGGGDGKEAMRVEKLTKREREIAALASTGMTNQQIADQLYLSEHTVKLHISNILKKLGLSNRTQLAIFGIQNL